MLFVFIIILIPVAIAMGGGRLKHCSETVCTLNQITPAGNGHVYPTQREFSFRKKLHNTVSVTISTITLVAATSALRFAVSSAKVKPVTAESRSQVYVKLRIAVYLFASITHLGYCKKIYTFRAYW